MVDNKRMDKLARSFFEDHDHGREAMQNASVTENICFIDYLENTCIKKAKEMKNSTVSSSGLICYQMFFIVR